MIKRLYLLAWLVLIAISAYAGYNGTFGAAEAIAVSVGAVGLVYGFALWAVMTGGTHSRPS